MVTQVQVAVGRRPVLAPWSVGGGKLSASLAGHMVGPDDGPDVPTSVALMRNARATSSVSVLSLRFQVVDDRPDWPVVAVLVDDEDPFARVAPEWRGFDPDTILGENSPLLPHDVGRRVAVYRCRCGEAGCGVIAPVIMPSPGRARVSWIDFRDYVGVFMDPVVDSVSEREGRSWDLPDLCFDREQYHAEIRRASRDRSWETPGRATAWLLDERVRPLGLVHPPGLPLRWVQPASDGDGVLLSFEGWTGYGARPEVHQSVLRLTSSEREPAKASRDMAERLLGTPPDEWARTFGWHRFPGH